MERQINIKFLPWQKTLFLDKSPFKGAIVGRGAGKTEYLITSSCLDMVQGKRVALFAQTQNQLGKEFMPRIVQKLHDWGFQPKYNQQKQTICIDKSEWTHKLFGQSYEAMEAYRGTDAIASTRYDELALCKDISSLLAITIPAMRNSGFTPIQEFGTTPRKGSEFDRMQREKGWFVLKGVSSLDNPYISDEEKENMKSNLSGDLYRQEVLGEVIDGDVEFAVFPRYILRKKCKGRRGARSLGIDCAGSGRDYNVFVVSDDFGILEIVKIQKADTFQLAATARQLIEKWGVSLVNIDGTGGFGQGLFDMLCVQYRFINSVNFGQSAVDSANFANARAEMFTQLAKDCEGGFSVEDDEICEELELISFDISNAGKRQLIHKEAIKKVLGRSPDCSDALALSRYRRSSAILNVNDSLMTENLIEELSGW